MGRDSWSPPKHGGRSMTSRAPLPRSWPAVAHVSLLGRDVSRQVCKDMGSLRTRIRKRIRLLSHSIRIEVQMSLGLSIDKLSCGGRKVDFAKVSSILERSQFKPSTPLKVKRF